MHKVRKKSIALTYGKTIVCTCIQLQKPLNKSETLKTAKTQRSVLAYRQ